MGQTFARTGAARHYIAFASVSLVHCLDLVLLEKERFAPVVAENLRCFQEQHGARGQFVHGRGSRVGLTDLKQRLRPQPRLLPQFVVDKLPSPVIGDGEE